VSWGAGLKLVDASKAVFSPLAGYLGRPVLDSEEQAAWDRRARSLTRTAVCMTGAVMVVLLVLSWPTDLLVMEPGSGELTWMVHWRSVITGCSAALFLAMLLVPPLWRHPAATALVVFWGANAYSGHATALAGGADAGVFYGVYSTFILTVLLVVPPAMRTWGTFILGASYFASAYVTDPGQLDLPMWGAPLMWSFGGAVTSIAVGHLIYSLLQSNFVQRRALDRRARELEEMDRAKNDFFANVNHELRTPLTNIIGALRTIWRSVGTAAKPTDVRGLDDASTKKAAEAGLRSAERLLLLVSDLLEMTRMDTGQGEPRKQVVDLRALSVRVADEFRVGPESRLLIDPECSSLPVPAEVDPHQIRTVLYNLLSNSFKLSLIGNTFVQQRCG